MASPYRSAKASSRSRLSTKPWTRSTRSTHVLGSLLAEVGVSRPTRGLALRSDLTLEPISRRPLVLPEETLEAAAALAPRGATPLASLVLVAYGDASPTKLCLESILVSTEAPTYELIVVDNGSDEAASEYLEELARANAHVRVIRNEQNAGFARALNHGLGLARGDLFVLLNNDVIVPPGWLAGLARHLEDESVGLAGPVTNRSGNESEVRAGYATYGEFLDAAGARREEYPGLATEISTLTMFCVAMRRDAYERIGPIDEGFGLGLLEDDDYSRRARELGYRLVCAEDVLVHHFGEASFGVLVPDGEYNRLLDENKRRFEEKWGVPWEPYERRADASYKQLVARVKKTVLAHAPESSTVLVVSAGDENLLELDGRNAWHFPQTDDGVYAGHYPADDAEAIEHLEDLRARGANFLVFPATSAWWLAHYRGLRAHLENSCQSIVRDDATCVVFGLAPIRSEIASPPERTRA